MDTLSKIGLFDLDGSLADYEAALERDLERLRAPEEAIHTREMNLYDLENEPHYEARMQLIKALPGWWLSLERIEMGFEVVRMAEAFGYEINVLTKGPGKHPLAWAEKIQWCNAQPELAKKQVHITMNKGLVYGTFLYDDYSVYMNAWLEHRPRGLGIMPVTATNADYTHPQVIRWDGSDRSRAKVQEALEIAYTRGFKEDLHLYSDLTR
jgi:5'-nucleotidase